MWFFGVLGVLFVLFVVAIVRRVTRSARETTSAVWEYRETKALEQDGYLPPNYARVRRRRLVWRIIWVGIPVAALLGFIIVSAIHNAGN